MDEKIKKRMMTEAGIIFSDMRDYTKDCKHCGKKNTYKMKYYETNLDLERATTIALTLLPDTTDKLDNIVDEFLVEFIKRYKGFQKDELR